MAARSLPKADDLGRLFSELLDKQVTAKAARPGAPPQKGPWIAATYGSDENAAVALLSDLNAAASLGAALSMLPAGRAEESVKSGTLEDVIRENFHEVCNVVTGLLNKPAAPGLVLTPLHLHGLLDEKDPKIAEFQAKRDSRLNMDIQVQGYAAGAMVLILL